MSGLFDDLIPKAMTNRLLSDAEVFGDSGLLTDDDLFGDLVPTSPRRELPAGITPSEGRSTTPMGRPDPRLEARRGTMRSVRPYVAGGPGLPDGAAAEPAAAPAPPPAAPAQFRDQREAVDDAVDRIAMGARPEEVFSAFERIGVPRQAIIARGEQLATKGFMPDTRPVTVRDGVAGGSAPQSIANVEPTAGQAVANFGRRVAARGSQAMTGALASMGAIGPDDAARLLARDEKKAQAAAVGTDLQRELEDLGQVKDWGDVPGALARNPSGVAVMLAESVALSIPAMATAFMGLPRVAMAAGVGVSSGALEYGSAMSEALADRGASLLDVDRVSALLRDEKFLADVRERGAKRGLAVGVVDALTAGIAGKFVEPALAAVRAGNIAGRDAVRKVAARSLAEVGVQAAGGAGGEALAQKLTGESKPLDIVMEALAEGFSAPFEVRSNLQATGALAAAASPESQIAGAIDDQVSRTYFRQDAIDGYVARAGDSRFYDPTFVDPQQTVAQPAGGQRADAAAGQVEQPGQAAQQPAPAPAPRVEDMPTTPFTPEQTAAMAAAKARRDAANQSTSGAARVGTQEQASDPMRPGALAQASVSPDGAAMRPAARSDRGGEDRRRPATGADQGRSSRAADGRPGEITQGSIAEAARRQLQQRERADRRIDSLEPPTGGVDSVSMQQPAEAPMERPALQQPARNATPAAGGPDGGSSARTEADRADSGDGARAPGQDSASGQAPASSRDRAFVVATEAGQPLRTEPSTGPDGRQPRGERPQPADTGPAVPPSAAQPADRSAQPAASLAQDASGAVPPSAAPPSDAGQARGIAIRETPRQNPTGSQARISHAEPGEAPERATPEVAARSLKQAAVSTGRTPAALRNNLIAQIDAAMSSSKQAGDPDVLALAAEVKARSSGQKGAAKRAADAAARVGYVTFDVPGDGRFTVLNTADRLVEFRRLVLRSPGFRAERQSAADTDRDAAYSPSTKAAIEAMVDDGDPQAAVDYAAAKGLDLASVGLSPRRLAAVAGLTPTRHSAAAAETSAPAPAPAPVTSAPPEAIRDAGLKIGGARKDRWRERGMNMADLDSITEAEAAELVNKAAVWRPDWTAMVEAGSHPTLVAMVKLMVDGIAAKPRDNTPAGRRRYVRAMQAVRSAFGDLAQHGEGLHAIEATAPTVLRRATAKLHDDLGVNSGDADAKREARATLFSIYKGRSDPFFLSGGIKRRAAALVAAGFPAKAEPWQRRYEVQPIGGPGTSEAGIQRYLALAGELDAPVTTEQLRAGAFTVQAKGQRDVLALAASREDAEAAAGALYAAAVAKRKDKADPTRPHLDVLTRAGLPPRIDRDVTPDELLRTFGFRGTEFGNWTAQDERQRMLNLAFDGLADLAELVGIPQRAISLNGTLGLAFGARGGGRFAAHYEPGKLVINLTKLQGGGSLAHEWAHALDHYLGELDRADAYQTSARGASGWTSRRPYNGRPQRRMVREDGRWVVREERPLSNLRTELADAVDQVMAALYETARPQAELVRAAEHRLDQLMARRAEASAASDGKRLAEAAAAIEGAQRSLEEARAGLNAVTMASDFAGEARKLSGKSADGYWLRPTEMFARAFEAYVFDRLVAMGARSDYLVHGVEEDRFAGPAYKGNPYPTGAERVTINAAFDRLVKALRTRQTEGGVALFKRDDDAQQMTAQAPATAEQVALVRSRVDEVTSGWRNAPEIRILASIADAPPAVREADAAQRAAGATGEPAAFTNDGVVYLVAGQLQDGQAVAEAVLHEAIGHHGLRAVFGADLDRLLGELSVLRAAEVRAKAIEYGLDFNVKAQRLEAAEEVLAELAQFQPDLTLVQRAVAAVRTWLREHVPVLADMRLSDAEVIVRYILPARDYVVAGAIRHGAAAGGNGPAFSRRPAEAGGEVAAFKAWLGSGAASAAGRVRLTEGDRPEAGSTPARPAPRGRLPDRVDVDGESRPATDSAGQPLGVDEEAVRAFWRRFAGSAVVDADGRPKRVFHGIRADSARPFKSQEVGPLGAGAYFRERQAEAVADDAADQLEPGSWDPSAAASYVVLRNPFVLNGARFRWPAGFDMPGAPGSPLAELVVRLLPEDAARRALRKLRDIPGVEPKIGGALRDALVAMGHDGLVVRFADPADGGDAYVAFDRGQGIRAWDDISARSRDEQSSARGDITQAPSRAITVGERRRPVVDSAGRPISVNAQATANFWRWFGDSRAVDSDGRPVLLFHGTGQDIAQFKPSRTGLFGGGIYLTGSAESADFYATTYNDAGAGRVYPVYARLRNPYVLVTEPGWLPDWYSVPVDAYFKHPEDYPLGIKLIAEVMPVASAQRIIDGLLRNGTINIGDALTKRLKAMGHDGIIAVEGFGDRSRPVDDKAWREWQTEVVAFDARDVKSAIGNNGDFSGQRRDIRFQRKHSPSNAASPDRLAKVSRQWSELEYLKEAARGENSRMREAQASVIDLPAQSGPPRSAQPPGGSLPGAGAVRADSPDTRFQRRPQGIDQPRDFELRSFGRAGRAVEIVQDRYNRWKQAIDDVRRQGGSVTDDNDFYRAEERYWGQVGSQIEAFKDELTEFVRAVSADGLRIEDVALYAYALHAGERNEWIARRRADMADSGSGMSSDEASDIIEAAKAAGVEDELRKHAATLQRWIRGTREVLLDGGLIDQQEHDAWSGMFRWYVPLRGADDAPSDTSAATNGGQRKARGGIRGDESAHATGRTSQAMQIIEQIAHDRARALIRAGRNNVLRAFARFVLDNPSPSLWEINTVRTRSREVIDEDGYRTQAETSEVIQDGSTITLKDGGEEIHIVVHDAKLLEQLRRMGVDERPSWALAALMAGNRWLSRVYTSLSPVFTVVNALRDTQAAAVGMIDEIGFLGAPKLFAALPRAWIESFKAEAGRPSADYQLFKAMGGVTHFHNLTTIDQQAAELASIVAAADRSALDPRKFLPKAMALIEALNGGIENATRLAAFNVARQSGRSVVEAASIAKNITVNFNRKGTQQIGNAWVLFFNPAVQGTARVVKAMANPKVVATLGVAMLGAAALAIRNAGMGEDDDGVAWWDKIPDEVKERNLVIVLPPGVTNGESVPGSKTGRYVKIPMPYGYNFFAVVANQVVDVWRHGQDPRRGRDVVQAGAKAFGAFTSSWLPSADLGRAITGDDAQSAGKSAVLLMVPDALDPLARIAMNQDGFGRQLRPDSRNSRTMPDSANYFPGQHGTLFQRGAAAVNAATGGSRFREGGIDVAPSTIEHLARSYGGGPVGFGLDVINALYLRQSIARPELDAKRLPFAKQFYSTIDAETDRLTGYQRLERAELVIEPIERAMKAGDATEARALRQEAGRIGALGPAVQLTRERLGDIVRRERSTIDSMTLKDEAKYVKLLELAAKRRKVLQDFNRAYDRAIAETVRQREQQVSP